MKIYIIVAVSENGVIGNKNGIPFNLLGDRIFFKKTTTGHAVAAGRITFGSYPDGYRPLPDRNNYILTNNKSYVPEPTNDRTFVCYSIMELINLAQSHGIKELFFGGGAEIYELIWGRGLVDAVYYTKVHAVVEGDTYFPSSINLDMMPKQEVLLEKKADEKNEYSFTVTRYSRN